MSYIRFTAPNPQHEIGFWNFLVQGALAVGSSLLGSKKKKEEQATAAEASQPAPQAPSQSMMPVIVQASPNVTNISGSNLTDSLGYAPMDQQVQYPGSTNMTPILLVGGALVLGTILIIATGKKGR